MTTITTEAFVDAAVERVGSSSLGLGISCVPWKPEFDRPELRPPAAAWRFDNSEAAQLPAKTIGRTVAVETVVIVIRAYTISEVALRSSIDAARNMRAAWVDDTVSSQQVSVEVGTIIRVSPESEVSLLKYAFEFTITFTFAR